MKDLKFRVKSPQHSTAIQKRLFELGYEWEAQGKVVRRDEEPFLFTYEDWAITFSNNGDEYFVRHIHTEATLDDLYSPEFLNEDSSNEDAFKQAFPELCRIADEMIEALNKIKKN
jgi:hypothetical protein